MVYYQRSLPERTCGIAETPKTQEQSFQSIAHERPGRKELHRVDDSHIQAVMLQYASVAQGIEQWFPVPCVGGSNLLQMRFFVNTRQIRVSTWKRRIRVDNFREWLSDNLRYILLGLAIILVLGIAIFVVRLIGGNTGGSQKEPINLTETKGTESATEGGSQAAQSETTAESTAQTEALVENNADILTFVTNYYTAIADKDLDSFRTLVDEVSDETAQTIQNGSPIESYNNIKVYSKSGPADKSYVVFVYYDAKLTGVDTLAPSLSCLYLKTNDEGTLYATDPSSDEQAKIDEIKSQDDVKALITDVKQQYEAARDSDENLKSVLSELGTPQTEVDLPEANTSGVEANKVVMCTDDEVNVRADSTTTADIIGTLSKGATVTRIQELDNGWSEIRYGDGTGYVSSEFLTEDLTALDQEASTEAQ